MSGGTFDYRDRILKDEIAPSLRAAGDENQDYFRGYVDNTLPLSADLVADLSDVLGDALHDLDWHYAGDTCKGDEELSQSILEKVIAVTEKHRLSLMKQQSLEQDEYVPPVGTRVKLHQPEPPIGSLIRHTFETPFTEVDYQRYDDG